MLALRNARVISVPISEAIGKMKTVEPDSDLVQTARAIGICFGD
jgi:hypothetical protein